MTHSTPIVTRRASGRVYDLFYLHLDTGDGSSSLPIAGFDLRVRPEDLPPPPATYPLDGHGLLVVGVWPTEDAEGRSWERRLYLRVL